MCVIVTIERELKYQVNLLIDICFIQYFKNNIFRNVTKVVFIILQIFHKMKKVLFLFLAGDSQTIITNVIQISFTCFSILTIYLTITSKIMTSTQIVETTT